MRRVDYRPSAALAAFALGVLLAPAPAGAACTVSTVGVAFGAYDPQSASPDDGTGTVNVGCHPSDPDPTVAMNAGLYGTLLTRRMASGANRLDYNLYTTAARTVIWGDGTLGTVVVTLTGGSVSGGTRRYSRTIYGRMPGSQNVPAGSYGDTVTVTVTW